MSFAPRPAITCVDDCTSPCSGNFPPRPEAPPLQSGTKRSLLPGPPPNIGIAALAVALPPSCALFWSVASIPSAASADASPGSPPSPRVTKISPSPNTVPSSLLVIRKTLPPLPAPFTSAVALGGGSSAGSETAIAFPAFPPSPVLRVRVPETSMSKLAERKMSPPHDRHCLPSL